MPRTLQDACIMQWLPAIWKDAQTMPAKWQKNKLHGHRRKKGDTVKEKVQTGGKQGRYIQEKGQRRKWHNIFKS